MYRLAEAALARRLAELEGATSITSARELVPKYLSREPLDPFTSASLRMSTGKQFYSVGPDKRDDGGTIQYDPTNGLVSSGDVMIRREAPAPIAN